MDVRDEMIMACRRDGLRIARRIRLIVQDLARGAEAAACYRFGQTVGDRA